MVPNFTKLLCLAALASLPVACASPGGPPLHEVAAEINGTLQPVRKTLAPGDQIRVAFAPGDLADWTHEVRVRPDGRASFLTIEEMDVFGMTPMELRNKLTSAYARVVDRPRLSVDVLEWAPRTISVMGEVNQAGTFEVDPHAHLNFTEALARAGGHRNRTAYLANTILVRWDPEQKRQRAWTFDARTRFWSRPEALMLQPYDLIFIPNTPIDRVGSWLDTHLRVLIPIPRIFTPGV